MPLPVTIASIPPEILGYVFFVIREGGITVLSGKLITLLHVTHTCSSWRTIALKNPYLWTDINIHLCNWSDRRVIGAASLCLYHSANFDQPPLLSLCIYVEQYLNYWRSPTGITSPEFLAPHANRVRRLCIRSPLLLTPFVFPHLTDLEVTTPGWEAHADMHVPGLLSRSGKAITHLSVGRVPDWDWRALLENTPHLEVLATQGTLPEEVMDEVSLGKLGTALSEVRCAVEIRGVDVFLNMLEARAPTNRSRRAATYGSVSVITNVSVQCMDVVLDKEQWERVLALAPEVQVVVLI